MLIATQFYTRILLNYCLSRKSWKDGCGISSPPPRHPPVIKSILKASPGNKEQHHGVQ